MPSVIGRKAKMNASDENSIEGPLLGTSAESSARKVPSVLDLDLVEHGLQTDRIGVNEVAKVRFFAADLVGIQAAHDAHTVGHRHGADVVLHGCEALAVRRAGHAAVVRGM